MLGRADHPEIKDVKGPFSKEEVSRRLGFDADSKELIEVDVIEQTTDNATSPKPPQTSQDLSNVWQEYRRTRSEELRDVLLTNYLPLVRYAAERLAAKLPDGVDLDNLISAGTIGLRRAIEAFEPERGIEFEAYCEPRIRGEILDKLRSIDWVPRLVRSRVHKLKAAMRDLEAELGRSPSQAEITQRLGVSMKEFRKIIRDGHAVSQMPSDRKGFDSDDSHLVEELNLPSDPKSNDPLSQPHRRDIKSLITRSFSRAEKLIITLYYYKEMTMKEIGKTLDLSEARVSEIHKSILQRLKEDLAKAKKEHGLDEPLPDR